MDRFAICEGYAWYAMFWGPQPDIEARLRRIGFRMGAVASLERADEETKRVYGRVVRDREWSYIAATRILRRLRREHAWPGTWNMTGGIARWLAGELGTDESGARRAMCAVMGES